MDMLQGRGPWLDCSTVEDCPGGFYGVREFTGMANDTGLTEAVEQSFGSCRHLRVKLRHLVEGRKG
jgi:hypothetical protein